MTDRATELEQRINDAQEAVVRAGDVVRSLKADLKQGNVEKSAVDDAIAKLKRVKLDCEALEIEYEKLTGIPRNKEAFRAQMTNVLERRLFIMPSFKIYGSVAGFFDFGPPGCAIKQNITQFWRQHFVLEEGMLELECPAVTPHAVLKASGHVDRFTDFMVTDMETGEPYRADHLLEGHLEKLIADKAGTPNELREAEELLAGVGELKADGLNDAIKIYGIKAPDTGNAVSDAFPFNLMFKTSIGPRGDLTGYLRPETAQGIFVNFRDLLYYNGGKLPFAAAQIGNSYRNEISPRAGLLRVREFTQAEIEHFVHPEDKSHPKFQNVSFYAPLLYSRALQKSDMKKPQAMALGEAVEKGIIANETLAYFIGRTYLFMKAIGMAEHRVRFRQHLEHEMAHYAEDCWDCEVETTYGWVECAGLADRSAYDLRAHAVGSNTELSAHEKFAEPKEVEQLSIKAVKKELGKLFKKDAGAIASSLEGMCEGDALDMKAKLEAGESVTIHVNDQDFSIAPGMVDIKKEKVKLHGRNYTPSVIEPSFGIGRIIYCMLEHTFFTRDGDGSEQRTAFSFTPLVAPIKATVFPLLNRPELNSFATELSAALTAAQLSNIVDTTGNTIGKRYARTDELGVPYAVTIDMDSLQDQTVTIRERDSMEQVRVPRDKVVATLSALASMSCSWADMRSKFPQQESRDEA